MSYVVSKPIATRRKRLLGTVVAAHVAIGFLLLTAKTVAPQLLESPLIVDLLQPVQPPKRIEQKPVPLPRAAAPQTPVPQRVAQPSIESTTSSVASANAPIAVAKPAPVPAPASEPVTSARFDADYLKNPAPVYPPVSRRRGEQGRVVLHVQVSAQGSAEQIEVQNSSGSSRLDEAAVATVRLWKFIPARRGDTSVQSWVLVPIVFKLEQ